LVHRTVSHPGVLKVPEIVKVCDGKECGEVTTKAKAFIDKVREVAESLGIKNYVVAAGEKVEHKDEDGTVSYHLPRAESIVGSLELGFTLSMGLHERSKERTEKYIESQVRSFFSRVAESN
jgi:hypothetical protein